MIDRRVLSSLLLVAAACAGPPTMADARWVTEFEYVRRGGACEDADGPVMCEIRVLVRDDGTWSASGVPTPPAEGTLPMGAASELAIVLQQSMRYFKEVPFDGICPTRQGGEEYGYRATHTPVGPDAERLEARVLEAYSCTFDMERHDALVKRNQIERAWSVLRPVELDHVEFR